MDTENSNEAARGAQVWSWIVLPKRWAKSSVHCLWTWPYLAISLYRCNHIKTRSLGLSLETKTGESQQWWRRPIGGMVQWSSHLRTEAMWGVGKAGRSFRGSLQEEQPTGTINSDFWPENNFLLFWTNRLWFFLTEVNEIVAWRVGRMSGMALETVLV
jgi:hypothetical protein